LEVRDDGIDFDSPAARDGREAALRNADVTWSGLVREAIDARLAAEQQLGSSGAGPAAR
jgi:hypothetical protein